MTFQGSNPFCNIFLYIKASNAHQYQKTKRLNTGPHIFTHLDWLVTHSWLSLQNTQHVLLIVTLLFWFLILVLVCWFSDYYLLLWPAHVLQSILETRTSLGMFLLTVCVNHVLFVFSAVPWGSYFDHALAWEKLINDSNIMIITFEQLKMVWTSSIPHWYRSGTERGHGPK